MIRACIDGYVFGMAPGGGIARYWTEIIRAASRLGLPIRFDVAVPPAARRPQGVPCRTIGSLSSYWAAARANLFHTTYYIRWPRMKCPSVATVYDFVDASFPLLRPNGEGFVGRQMDALKRASAVVAISKSTRDLAATLAGVDPARLFVAYPAVAAPFAQPLPGEAEIRKFRAEQTGGAPYLVHVGDRRNYKNFRTLLKAFCRAAPSMDRHLLILGGKHPLAEDELDWVYAARLSNRVHVCARVDDAALRLAYAGADAMVHASRMEGFGIPVIEALACGTGLILSDIPVYREIADGRAVFAEADDVDAWERALKSDVRVQPGWREEILKRYTWEAAARAHLDAYRSVLA